MARNSLRLWHGLSSRWGVRRWLVGTDDINGANDCGDEAGEIDDEMREFKPHGDVWNDGAEFGLEVCRECRVMLWLVGR